MHVTDVGGRHQGLDKVLLLQRLKGDHVHAHLAAVVAAGEPVPAGVAQRRLVARPGDPVALAAEREVADCKKKKTNLFYFLLSKKKENKRFLVLFSFILVLPFCFLCAQRLASGRQTVPLHPG